MLARVRTSIHDSAGEVIFGMEDGTVSIFGLVAGVAVTATSSTQVLLAGAAGAAAAAVSMGAGVFLDRQTVRAQTVSEDRHLDAETQADPAAVQEQIRQRLESGGMHADRASQVVEAAGNDPGDILLLAKVLDDPLPDRTSTLGHAVWMFFSNLFAGVVPVIPFGFLAVEAAKVTSIGMTFVMIVLLGIGRSVVGKTRLLPTILSTLLIAAAAAGAGVLFSNWLASIT